MTPAFRYTLLWVLATTVMVIAALSSLSSVYAHGQYVPDNADAFYHARRILDAVMTHQPVAQFDPKMHVPEGSWINWPWGYDQLMAWIADLFGPYANEQAAFRFLAHVPPAFCAVAMGLLVIIARQVRLAFWHTAILALAFALTPAAFRGFSIGNLDHHYAELTFMLAMLAAGLRFFREGEGSIAAGATLGAVLGIALAIHQGLLVLQIPLCLTLGLRWLRDEPLPERRSIWSMAVALAVTTLLVCIPSETWRRGFFEFYTLSWFHLYASTVVAVFSVLLTVVRRNRIGVIALCVLAALAVAPVARMLIAAGEFVSGNLSLISTISEAKSPYRLLIEGDDNDPTMYMSYWLFLMLPMTLVNLWWAWKKRDAAGQFLAIVCAWGLVFFQMQYRFGTYGVVPMLLTPIVFAQSFIGGVARWRRILPAITAVGFALAYIPTMAAWSTTFVLGNNLAYFNLQTIWPRFAELCEKRPGVVMADIDAGHWIRYHTKCSVIANVFLLTPQHVAKVNENTQMLFSTPAQLLANRHDIDYVLVFHAVIIRDDENGKETPNLEELRMRLAPLERDLLGPDAQIPGEFKKRWEIRSPQGQVYSRLYEIVRN